MLFKMIPLLTTKKVDFFGETYTTDDHKPPQSKVSTIVEMPLATCKMQIQSFIGMVNYLSKFTAKLSELAEPIRELSKDKVPFTGILNTKQHSSR